MSLIELQQYQLLNVDDILLNIDDTRFTVDYINSNQKSQRSIAWLDKFILYCPMYVINKPNGSKRNKCMSILIICIIVMANIALEIPFIYSLSSININNAINIICHMIKLCSRFCGLYYFSTKFDYQYRYYIPKFDQSSNKSNDHNMLLILILIMFVLVEIAWIYGVCFDSNYYNIHQNISLNWLQWAYCIVNAIFFDAPSILTLVIHYRLTIKYRKYLRQIINELKKENIIDVETIFDRYKALYHSFNTEYVFILKLTVQCYLFYVMLALWINTDSITYWKGNDYSTVLWRTAVNIWCMLAVMMYVFPSSYVCKMYYKLDDELWNYMGNSEQFIRKENQQQISCNYLLHFMKKFPVIIRIGNVCTVSIHNFVLLMFAFVVAKFVNIF
eukprot:360551_1